MKVKYIGSKLETPSSFKLGKEYVVLEVLSTCEGGMDYRIIPEHSSSPILVKVDLFQIIDNKPAPNWVIQHCQDRYLAFCPYQWGELGFWEDYFNFDKEAEQIFEAEKKIIFSQYPELCPPEPPYKPVIKVDIEGNIKNGFFLDYKIKIVGDLKVSGGYLMSIYKNMPNEIDSKDEWFDTYEELEAYFKRDNLQVDWLNSD